VRIRPDQGILPLQDPFVPFPAFAVVIADMVSNAFCGVGQDVERATQRFEYKPNAAFAQSAHERQEPAPRTCPGHDHHPLQPRPHAQCQGMEPKLQPLQRSVGSLEVLVFFFAVDEFFVERCDHELGRDRACDFAGEGGYGA